MGGVVTRSFNCGTKYDVLVLGKSGVGKTSIIDRMNEFASGQPRTIKSAPPPTKTTRTTVITTPTNRLIVRESPSGERQDYYALTDAIIYVIDGGVDQSKEEAYIQEAIDELYDILNYKVPDTDVKVLVNIPVFFVINKSKEWINKHATTVDGQPHRESLEDNYRTMISTVYHKKWEHIEDANRMYIVWTWALTGSGCNTLLERLNMILYQTHSTFGFRGKPPLTPIAAHPPKN